MAKMEIASVFLKSADLLLKITTSPIGKEIKSICKYESEIKRCADTITMIGDVLSDVEGKHFQGKAVRRAYKRLREAYLDAQDFLDAVEAHRKKLHAVTRKFSKEKQEILMNNTISKRKQLIAHARIKKKTILLVIHRVLCGGPNQAKHAVKMHKAIKKIRKNLDEIEKDMRKLELIKEPIITSAATDHVKYRATGPCVDADKVIGREEDNRKIVDLLISPAADHPKKIPVISIVGIGGLGKTTTAQLLYNDEIWQKRCGFDLKLWVPDCKKLDVKSMLKNILKSIGHNDTSISVDSLDENHLREQLVKGIGGKSFFLVLDDVENEDLLIWENLESLLNHGNRGKSRILVTTRSRKVADIMGSDSPYELWGLSDTDAFELFERYAFRSGRDESLLEIGKLCVNRCLGVPLPIKVIGSLLCDVEGKGMWERIWRDIDSVIKDESNPIIPILMISYYNLDSTLKQCFSYCALFPKNHHISMHNLSSIWRANIRLENGSGLLEDDCEKNMKTLCDRCFIEEAEEEWDESKHGCFKMHDLMHDLANSVAGEEMSFVVNSNSTVDSNKLVLEENVRHFSLMGGEIEDGKFASFEIKGKRLRTFLQLDPPSDITPRMKFSVDELVLGCPVLRLLDIHSQGIESLTNSIGKLIHLRYLDLSYNSFQILPNSIVELINLRHLSLANCEALARLPSGMDALTSLQVLDLDTCRQLEELPMGALSSLQVLDISGCVKSEEQLIGIDNLINLRILNLKECMGLTRLPSGMGALTSLQVLDISNCTQLEELPVGILKLINLKHLNVAVCESLSNIPCGIEALTSLQVLDLSHCERLVELPIGILKLINLKYLIFDGSNALIYLPSGISAELKSGKILKIELPNNTTLKEFNFNTLDGEAFSLNKKWLWGLEIKWKDDPKEEVGSNHIEILAKLQPPSNLVVFQLDGYQGMQFPPWFLNVNSVLLNLRDIHISNCGKCRILAPLSRLPCLEYLELCSLSNLEYIEECFSCVVLSFIDAAYPK